MGVGLVTKFFALIRKLKLMSNVNLRSYSRLGLPTATTAFFFSTAPLNVKRKDEFLFVLPTSFFPQSSSGTLR